VSRAQDAFGQRCQSTRVEKTENLRREEREENNKGRKEKRETPIAV
jgi:hypothetical protein